MLSEEGIVNGRIAERPKVLGKEGSS